MNAKQRVAEITFRLLRWAHDHLRPGVRTLVGIVFILGGLLWFLPILGIWMLPLGLAIVSLDIPRFRPRILRWMVSLHTTAYPHSTEPYRPTSSQ